MKRISFKNIIAIIVVVIVVALIGLFLNYNSVINKPLKSDKQTISIEVKDGEGFNSLLDRLDTEGVLKNKLYIKLNIKLNKEKTTIIPGNYEVKTDISLEELLKILQTEDIAKNQIAITIPEGYNIDEMAKLFEEKGLFSQNDFITSAKNYELPNYIKKNDKKKYNLEGFLYPDTYYFNKDVDANQVIKTMNEKFEDMIKEISKSTGKEIKDDDIERIITIASLIEEEAQVDEERKIVSSVIVNRLNKGMDLEFCSTINYAWGEHIENLRNKHLEIDSPYNTYKNSGLPIGPIDNPGRKSIEAAIEPDNTDYLYFMLLYNQGGKHHFSNNGTEHEKVKLEEEAKARENK